MHCWFCRQPLVTKTPPEPSAPYDPKALPIYRDYVTCPRCRAVFLVRVSVEKRPELSDERVAEVKNQPRG